MDNRDFLQFIKRTVELNQCADIKNIRRKSFICQLVVSQTDKLQFGEHSEETRRHTLYVIKLKVELLQPLRKTAGDFLQLVSPHIQDGERFQPIECTSNIIYDISLELKAGQIGRPLE